VTVLPRKEIHPLMQTWTRGIVLPVVHGLSIPFPALFCTARCAMFVDGVYVFARCAASLAKRKDFTTKTFIANAPMVSPVISLANVRTVLRRKTLSTNSKLCASGGSLPAVFAYVLVVFHGASSVFVWMHGIHRFPIVDVSSKGCACISADLDRARAIVLRYIPHCHTGKSKLVNEQLWALHQLVVFEPHANNLAITKPHRETL